MPLDESSRPNKRYHYASYHIPDTIYVNSGNTASTLNNIYDPPHSIILSSYFPSNEHIIMRDEPRCAK